MAGGHEAASAVLIATAFRANAEAGAGSDLRMCSNTAVMAPLFLVSRQAWRALLLACTARQAAAPCLSNKQPVHCFSFLPPLHWSVPVFATLAAAFDRDANPRALRVSMSQVHEQVGTFDGRDGDNGAQDASVPVTDGAEIAIQLEAVST
jgi:hypothetical protein